MMIVNGMDEDQLNKQYSPLIEKTVSQYKNTGIPEGILRMKSKMLLKQAINTYEPSKGNFTVHLQNNLMGMNRYVNNASTIYIPEIRANRYKKYTSAVDDLSLKLDRTPTLDEISDHLHMPREEIERMSQETGKKLLVGDDYETDVGHRFFDHQALLDFVHKKTDDPMEKEILEHTFGLNGKPMIDNNMELAKKYGVSEGTIRNKKEKLIERIGLYA